MEEYLGLYFKNYYSNYLAIWIVQFYLYCYWCLWENKVHYQSGFCRVIWIPGTCHFGDGCFDILVPQCVDERVEDRCENSKHHVAHDVEVEGHVSPVGHVGYGNGWVVGANHQEVRAAGRKGFGASFSGADAKHWGQDVSLGEKHQEKGQEGHHHGDAEAHEGLGGGVRAGGLN